MRAFLAKNIRFKLIGLFLNLTQQTYVKIFLVTLLKVKQKNISKMKRQIIEN